MSAPVKKKKPATPAQLRRIEKRLDWELGRVEQFSLMFWHELPFLEGLTVPKTLLKRLDVIIRHLTLTRRWMAARVRRAS